MAVPSKTKSFIELEQAAEVSAAELASTLKHHAEGGMAITGHIVIALINRVTLSLNDIATLRESAEAGYVAQLIHHPRCALEYLEVSRHLDTKK